MQARHGSRLAAPQNDISGAVSHLSIPAIRHILRFRSKLIAMACLAIAFADPAAARGLSGAFRADFVRIYGEGCMKAARADAEISKLPEPALAKLCRCTGEHMADRLTPAELDRPDSQEMRAVEMDAARACAPR